MNKALFSKLTKTPSLVTIDDIPANWNSPEGDSWAEFFAGFRKPEVFAAIPRAVANQLALVTMAAHVRGERIYLPDAWSLDVSDEHKITLVKYFFAIRDHDPTSDDAGLAWCLEFMLEGNNYLPKGNAAPKEAMDLLVARIGDLRIGDLTAYEGLVPHMFGNLSCPSGLLRAALVDPASLPFKVEGESLDRCRYMAASNPALPDEVATELLSLRLADDISWGVAIDAKPSLKKAAAEWYAAMDVPEHRDFMESLWEQSSRINEAAAKINEMIGRHHGWGSGA